MAATLQFEALKSLGELGRWGILAVGVVLGVGTGLRKTTRRVLARPGLTLGIPLFVLACFVSTFWSIDPRYSFLRSVSVALLLFCSFVTLRRWVDQFGDTRLMIWLTGILAGILALNLVVGGLGGGGTIYGRFHGFFENPNNIGMITALGLPLSFGLALSRRSPRSWGIWAVFVLSAVACGSRTALLGGSLAMVLILLPRAARGNQSALFWGVVMGAGLLVFSRTSFFEERILRAETLETLSTRTIFWEYAAEWYIPARPWQGYGFGCDGLIHEYFGNKGLMELQLRGYGVMSSYYGLAIQLGVPLAVGFFLYFWSIPLRGLATHLTGRKTAVYSATVISGLLTGITEAALFSAGNCFAWLFWMTVMLTVRRIRITTAVQKRKTRRDRWKRMALYRWSPPPAPSAASTTPTP